MSHTTTQSVCLSVSGTKGLALGGGPLGFKGPAQPQVLISLPGYVPSGTETTLPTMQHSEQILRRANSTGVLCGLSEERATGLKEEDEEMEKDPSLYFIPEDHSSSESFKALETVL